MAYNGFREAHHLVPAIPRLSNLQFLSILADPAQRQQVQYGLVVDLQHAQGDGVRGGLFQALHLVEQFLDGARGHSLVGRAALHGEGLAGAGLSVREDAHVVAI